MKLYFDSKFFQKKEFDKETISKYFRNAVKNFQIALKNKEAEVIFNFSYFALIKTGISLIAFFGYRVRSKVGHHVKILEKLSRILDDEDIEIIGNKMRKKRNLDFYEAEMIVSQREARDYLNFVDGVIKKAEEYLKSQKSLF